MFEGGDVPCTAQAFVQESLTLSFEGKVAANAGLDPAELAVDIQYSTIPVPFLTAGNPKTLSPQHGGLLRAGYIRSMLKLFNEMLLF